jgi:hypothetical protein
LLLQATDDERAQDLIDSSFISAPVGLALTGTIPTEIGLLTQLAMLYATNERVWLRVLCFFVFSTSIIIIVLISKPALQ